MSEGPPAQSGRHPGSRFLWLFAVAATLAVTAAVTLALIYPIRELALTGANDFLSFYAGGRLAFEEGLYDPIRVQRVQKEFAGTTSETLPFIRLPAMAALLWPISRLPYPQAYAVWQALSLAAVLLLAFTWSITELRPALLALAASIPLQWSFANGQDLPWILLFFLLALRWAGTRKDFLAGFALSLCLSKYHLFLLVPLALLSKQRARITYGFASGAIALLGASTAIAGAGWPEKYFSLLLQARLHRGDLFPPNLFGLLSWAGVSWILIGAGIVSTAVLLFAVLRRADTQVALAASLLASLLVAPHLFVQDLVLLAPVCLIILARRGRSGIVGFSAMWLLAPVPYLLELTRPFPAGQTITLGMLALLASLAIQECRTAVPAHRCLAPLQPAPSGPETASPEHRSPLR